MYVLLYPIFIFVRFARDTK